MIANTDYGLCESKSLKEKHDFFNVEAELSLNILGGWVTPSGSAKFLKENSSTSNSSSFTLKFCIVTEAHEVRLRHLKEFIDFKALEEEEFMATHVVTGVEYGAKGLVTTKYSYTDEDHKKTIQGSLKAQFGNLDKFFKVSGGFDLGSVTNKNREENVNFEYHWSCDVGNTDTEGIPRTYEDAMVKMSKLPQMIKETGKGIGKPMKLTLTPLSKVRKMFQIERNVNIIYRSLTQETLTAIMQQCQELEENLQKYTNLAQEVEANASYVPQKKRRKVEELKNKAIRMKAKLMGELKDVLYQVKSGSMDAKSLDEWMASVELGLLGSSSLEKTLLPFQSILETMKNFRLAEDMGIYVCKESYIVKSRIEKYSSPDVADFREYIFYTNIFEEEPDEQFYDYLNCFLQLKKSTKDENVQFYWVESEFSNADVPDLSICHLRNGNVIQKDVYQDYKKEFSWNLIDMSLGQHCSTISPNRALLEIKCPSIFER